MNDGRLSAELLRLIGPMGLIALAEAFGGTRLYVPKLPDSEQGRALANAVGDQVALALIQRYRSAPIRVPLARELRARYYRGELGMSNAQIAVKLGMTETGVDKIFHAMPAKPRRAKVDPRQINLFD